jgi:hypothetical protein
MFCDAASTIHFMLETGPESELHPAISFISQILGPVAGPLFGATLKVIVGVFIAIYWRRFAVHIFLIASLVSFWAAWYNVWGSEIYTANIVNWIPW